jgi:hypothetical protein
MDDVIISIDRSTRVNRDLVGKLSCWVTRQRARYDHCIGTCECYYLVSSFVF